MLPRRHPSPSSSSTLSLAKSLIILISYIPAFHSRPTTGSRFDVFDVEDKFPEESPGSPAFWWKLGISLILVLLGGVFAGIRFNFG